MIHMLSIDFHQENLHVLRAAMTYFEVAWVRFHPIRVPQRRRCVGNGHEIVCLVMLQFTYTMLDRILMSLFCFVSSN